MVACKCAEDLDVDVVRPAAAGEQLLQAVLVVVLVGELEQRLLERAGEPDDGALRISVVPGRPKLDAARASQGVLKRVSSAAAAASSTNCGVRVLLEEAGGDRRR